MDILYGQATARTLEQNGPSRDAGSTIVAEFLLVSCVFLFVPL